MLRGVGLSACRAGVAGEVNVCAKFVNSLLARSLLSLLPLLCMKHVNLRNGMEPWQGMEGRNITEWKV